jgi:hypothetical protein
MLKMFALQKYIKKKQEEKEIIHEKREEIKAFTKIIPKVQTQ